MKPLPKPSFTEVGQRKVYEGSLSAQNTELTDAQRTSILSQLDGNVRTPTELVENTAGLNPQNPFHGESVRRYLGELTGSGKVTQNKKPFGWTLAKKEKAELSTDEIRNTITVLKESGVLSPEELAKAIVELKK